MIAIAGPPGAGKSALAQALARLLGEACVVDMDDYQRMTALPPAQVADWLARGADHDALPVPLLAEHLAALKAGRPVRNPASGATTMPARTIVLETHFGRAHRATGAFIDCLLWLDTPADVALARNLRAFIAPWLAPQASAADRLDGLLWLDAHLADHLGLVARLVALQRERVRPGADLLVDPAASAEATLQQVLAKLAG